MSKIIRLKIDGMTCINCQNKIEKSLNSQEGVIRASVNFSKGTADIEYDENKISKEKIIKQVEELDYRVLRKNRNSFSDILDSVGIVFVILSLFWLFQTSGVLNLLAPAGLADTNMGYGMLFVIGVVTSVHCISMCGGIGLSQSLVNGSKYSESKKGKTPTFMPALSYNMGRVFSYTVIGFLLGFFGMIMGGRSNIGVSTMLQGLLKIAAGMFTVVMGMNTLGIFPWLRRFSIHTPIFIARMIGVQKKKEGRPFLIGLLNGVMPCGPLQAMWIVALATANPFSGALSMFMFSLGTVPLMLGLGSAISLLGKKYSRQVMKVGGVLVTVLGLSMITQGVNLGGFNNIDPVGNAQIVRETQEAEKVQTDEPVDGIQLVNSTLSFGSYPDITVQEGIPVRWTIEVPEGSLTGCNFRMIIPDYGIVHTFDYGENVIEFVPEKPGRVRYTCWMGMIQGNINVI